MPRPKSVADQNMYKDYYSDQSAPNIFKGVIKILVSEGSIELNCPLELIDFLRIRFLAKIDGRLKQRAKISNPNEPLFHINFAGYKKDDSPETKAVRNRQDNDNFFIQFKRVYGRIGFVQFRGDFFKFCPIYQ